MFPGTEIAGVRISRGGLLAAELRRFVARFLSLIPHVKALLPMWVLHTYVYREFEFTPYLNIISP
jgi:hypothetical protein